TRWAADQAIPNCLNRAVERWPVGEK
ncbi:Os09g0112100, partial [Oryza sativa Japonica Group]